MNNSATLYTYTDTKIHTHTHTHTHTYKCMRTCAFGHTHTELTQVNPHTHAQQTDKHPIHAQIHTLYIYLSVYLSIYISIYLSIYIFTYSPRSSIRCSLLSIRPLSHILCSGMITLQRNQQNVNIIDNNCQTSFILSKK